MGALATDMLGCDQVRLPISWASATRWTSAGCRVTRITGDGRRLPGSNEVPPDDRTVGGCRSSVLRTHGGAASVAWR